MKKNKLSLRKITVSNLSEDFAKRIFGGDDTDLATYNDPAQGPNCTDSCTENNCQCTLSKGNDCHTNNACASGPEQPGCTQAPGGCTGEQCPSDNNHCFTQLDCTHGQCTDVQQTCPATHMDASCANGPATCSC
ncbi:MAG: hypothetical protein J7621_19040 [Niastella sp.]|nr:hypothetical protein [Niastella sp.]